MQQGERIQLQGFNNIIQVCHSGPCARSALHGAGSPCRLSRRSRRRRQNRKLRKAIAIEVPSLVFPEETCCQQLSKVEAADSEEDEEETVAGTSGTEDGTVVEDEEGTVVEDEDDEVATELQEDGHAAPDEPIACTEVADIGAEQVVHGLAKLLKHMANLRANEGEESKCSFQSVKMPKISLSAYASRIHKYFNCSDECFVLCMAYIDRIVKCHSDIQVTDLTCHRLLLTSTMVAAKFHDDQYGSNEYFAKVGGIAVAEMNALEAEFLKLLDWKLYVGAADYEWYLQAMCGIP